MFLRSITLAAIILMLPGLALAQYYSPYGTGTGSNPASHPVQGYTTNQGTYVPPHYATNPNATQRDNYTAKGNVNPYTGAVGTRPPGY